ncbi:MAG: hypothetical protein LUE99_18330, partial [Bacteroides sp.]|nr:hypothetical protein [Bacteroides sp.]
HGSAARQGLPPLRRINENMWVLDCPFTLLSVNKLPTPLFNYFNRRNNRKLGEWIRQQAESIGFHDYVHLIDTDIFRSRYIKEYLRPDVSIYYRATTSSAKATGANTAPAANKSLPHRPTSRWPTPPTLPKNCGPTTHRPSPSKPV